MVVVLACGLGGLRLEALDPTRNWAGCWWWSVLLNDSFALDFICATPLEQFQILPLSAQVYPASASISSLEQCNLFPQVSTDSEFVYISGAGLAAKLTS